MSDFLLELEAELDGLLVEAAKKKSRADEMAALQKKRGNMKLPPAIRQAAGEHYKALAAEAEAERWASTATIAMFTAQTCDGCDTVHHIFLQYMEEQCLLSKPETRRWIRVSRPNLSLPKETLLQPHTTHICSSCCEDHDFFLTTSSSLKPTERVVSPSTTYIQEDINAKLS